MKEKYIFQRVFSCLSCFGLRNFSQCYLSTVDGELSTKHPPATLPTVRLLENRGNNSSSTNSEEGVGDAGNPCRTVGCCIPLCPAPFWETHCYFWNPDGQLQLGTIGFGTPKEATGMSGILPRHILNLGIPVGPLPIQNPWILRFREDPRVKSCEFES